MARVAKALIYDKEGNALVLRRSGTHPTHAYQADLPGGIVEANETITEGLAREIYEEIGLRVQEADLQPANMENVIGSYRRQLYTLHLPEVAPEVQISWEHDRYEWVPQQKLAQALESNDYFIRGVQNYIKHKK